MWRDIAVSLSLANLIYLRIWSELLNYHYRDTYWLKTAPPPPHLIALMINVLVLAGVLWLIIARVRLLHSRFASLAPLGFLVILFTLVNSLHSLVGDPKQVLVLNFLQQRIFSVGIILAIVSVVVLIFGGTRLLRPILIVLVLLAPFAAIAFGEAVYRIANYDRTPYTDKPLAPLVTPQKTAHVVWVIFDEWDQALTFTERPQRVQLPEIDRFRAHAIYASDASSPAGATDWAMPALIMGRMVEDISPAAPDELSVWPAGTSQPVPWSEQPNVFGRARLAGFNSALVGWALPYCRVLNTSLSGCWWWSGSNQYNSSGTRFPEILVNQPRSLFETIYRSPFGQSLSTKRHAALYNGVIERSLEVATDRRYNLVLLHMPVPHPPYFYDSSSGSNTLGSTPVAGLVRQTQKGYLDALMLVDRSVGKLRATLESAGQWDSTTILLSSDHPFRHRPQLDGHPVGKRVPFLLKLAGQTAGTAYDPHVNTVISNDLLLAILRGELPTAQTAASWLDGHHVAN